MMVALRLGVGLNKLLLVITTLIWRGCTPVYNNNENRQSFGK
jgi:hypothetical protein